MAILDFTSALYLGFRHPHRSLPKWEWLTTGRPAAVGESPKAGLVAAQLAALIGCESALLGASTLHLFTDLVVALRGSGCALYADRELYPVAGLAMSGRTDNRSGVIRFEHHSPDGLSAKLDATSRADLRPVVLTDSVCPRSGRVAPLGAYVRLLAPRSGLVVVDDTQGIGLLGGDPTPDMQYGRGGGGSLRYLDIPYEGVLVISSLAKSFGVPVAVAAGSRTMIDRLRRLSFSRVSCSPPSTAHLHAAEMALHLNRKCGNVLRLRLLNNVRELRQVLGDRGLQLSGGLFPVQTVVSNQACDPERLYQSLLQQGVRTVLCSARGGKTPTLSFVVTALHNRRDFLDLKKRLDIALRNRSGPDKHKPRRINSEVWYE